MTRELDPLCYRGQKEESKHCHTCKHRHTFYSADPDLNEIVDEQRHECRINPPCLGMGGDPDGWPSIELSDWCADWEQRQVPDVEVPF